MSKTTTEIMRKSAAVRAGIDPKWVWLHMFRHSYCTYLLQQNVSPAKAMQLLRHSTMEMVMHVVQPAPSWRRHGRCDQRTDA